jgi:hypothetical protein
VPSEENQEQRKPPSIFCGVIVIDQACVDQRSNTEYERAAHRGSRIRARNESPYSLDVHNTAELLPYAVRRGVVS